MRSVIWSMTRIAWKSVLLAHFEYTSCSPHTPNCSASGSVDEGDRYRKLAKSHYSLGPGFGISRRMKIPYKLLVPSTLAVASNRYYGIR